MCNVPPQSDYFPNSISLLVFVLETQCFCDIWTKHLNIAYINLMLQELTESDATKHLGS
jgi:hypothetical protein